MHEGMGLDRMNALGRHRFRIKLGNILVDKPLSGLLAAPLHKHNHSCPMYCQSPNRP